MGQVTCLHMRNYIIMSGKGRNIPILYAYIFIYTSLHTYSFYKHYSLGFVEIWAVCWTAVKVLFQQSLFKKDTFILKLDKNLNFTVTDDGDLTTICLFFVINNLMIKPDII